MSVIEMEDVQRRYPRVVALDGLSLRVPERAIYALLGRNGSGKTTTMRLCMAMLHPHRGTVRVFGEDPWQKQVEVKSRIGYLSEDMTLPQRLRVQEIFSFYSSCYPKWDWDMVERWVERFAIPVNVRLVELSKGQQRQVGLICAIAPQPELLVLDEPWGGLDVVVRRRFLEAVVEMLNEGGSTVFLSSHQLGEGERLATHVGFLSGGRLILEEPLDQLKETYSRVHFESLPDTDLDAMRALPEFVGSSVTPNGEAMVSLRVPPGDAREWLMAATSAPPAETVGATLEDIFFDLVGDEA